MLFAVAVLTVAVAIGFATGGRISNLGHLPLRYGGLVALAVLAQLGGTLLGGTPYAIGLALSALLVAAFLVKNRGIHGTTLVALGLLSNAVVVGLNGAMPVSAYASGKAEISTQDLIAGVDPRHELASSQTTLRPLGDVIPVLLPVRAEVVSPGDVLVAAGLAQLIVTGMRRRVA